jgi:hypothetical protein
MNVPQYQWGNNERVKTILSLEEKYPVQYWKINGIHVWPIIRLFIYIETWVESEKKNVSDSKVNDPEKRKTKPLGILERLFLIAKFVFFLVRPLKKSRAIFASAPTCIEEYRGKHYHKYFDPLRTSDSRYLNSYIVFSGRQPVKGIHNQMQAGSFQYILQLFSKYYRRRGFQNELDRFGEFRQELSSHYRIGNRLTIDFLQEAIVSIEKYAFLFSILLRKTRAKEAISICYYNDTREHYGLNLAAQRMGIPSRDMQHGGQGILHMAYSQFYKLPDSRKFELLPSTFWCWDEQSAKPIIKWIRFGSANHGVEIVGHPWFQFLKVTVTAKEEKPIIVYSLQPFQTLILPEVLECIKHSGTKYSWVLRLHPSMTGRKDELRELIEYNQIEKSIHPQTFYPLSLPETLAQASLHITRTSGTLIEATLMGLTTLVLDTDGKNAYEEYIQNGLALDASLWTAAELTDYITKKFSY